MCCLLAAHSVKLLSTEQAETKTKQIREFNNNTPFFFFAVLFFSSCQHSAAFFLCVYLCDETGLPIASFTRFFFFGVYAFSSLVIFVLSLRLFFFLLVPLLPAFACSISSKFEYFHEGKSVCFFSLSFFFFFRQRKTAA